jgi:hypothetical protein
VSPRLISSRTAAGTARRNEKVVESNARSPFGEKAPGTGANPETVRSTRRPAALVTETPAAVAVSATW